MLGSMLMVVHALLTPWVYSRLFTFDEYSAYVLGFQFLPLFFLLVSPLNAAAAPLISLKDTKSEYDVRPLLQSILTVYLLLSIVGLIVAIITFIFMPTIINSSENNISLVTRMVLIQGVSISLTIPAYFVSTYACSRGNYILDNVLRLSGPWVCLILVVCLQYFYLLSGRTISLDDLIIILFLSYSSGSVIVFLIGVSEVRKIVYLKISIIVVAKYAKFILLKILGSYWWQVSALVTLYSGVLLVSYFEYDMIASYGLASTLMVFVSGLSTVVAGPISIELSRERSIVMMERVFKYRKYQRLFILVTSSATIGLILIPDYVMNFWVGELIGMGLILLIPPIALGHFFRQLTSVYSMNIVGMGKQNILWLSPLVESISAVLIGILLGSKFGAVGVAYGFMISGMIRLLMMLYYDIRLMKNYMDVQVQDVLFPWIVERK